MLQRAYSPSNWDDWWLGLAEYVSTRSKDPSTQVGAVIARDKEFISFGYNGFPPQIEDKKEWYEDRETKYRLVIHAEANAILNNRGMDLRGAACYTFPLTPCGECAKLLVAAGIRRVVARIGLDVREEQRDPAKIKQATEVFDKAGVDFKWQYKTL